MSDETGPAQDAADPEALVEVADHPREPTAYEKRLRSEARQHRQRAIEAERQRDEAITAARAESERMVAGVQSAANERIVRAELKAYAVKAGIVDLDGLRLLDLSGVRMTETGDVEGAESLIANLRTAKPWLFGLGSSSSSAKPPPEQQPRAKKASEMSIDEWKAARQELIRRR